MRKTITGFPVCSHAKRDCCNVDSRGGCIALNSTQFKRPCPFYLSWQDVKPGDRKYHATQIGGQPF